jgi:hypothetical protein
MSVFYSQHSYQGKRYTSVRLGPLKSKKASQISVFEHLTIRLVTLFVPSSLLAVLHIALVSFRETSTDQGSYLPTVPKHRAYSPLCHIFRLIVTAVT